MNTDIEKKRGLHYGWVIIAMLYLMVFISLGFCNGPRSLYMPVITSELGILRSLYSFTDSFRYIVVAIGNMFFGAIVVKFGARKLVAAGFVSLMISTLVASFAETLPVFYISGVFQGIGFVLTTTAMVSFFVDRWCVGNKGTVTGICLSASGLGGAASAQVLSPMINGGEGMWRMSYRTVTLILLAVGLLIVLLLRESPEEKKLEPLTIGGKGKKKRGPDWSGISYAQAKKKAFFYITVLSLFLVGCSIQALANCSAAHMKDVGISPETVTNAYSVYSIFLAVAKVSAGVFFDYFGLRAMLTLCTGFGLVALILLAFIAPGFNAMPYITYIISAFALPLETVAVPLTAGDMFGQKDYPRFLGLFLSAMTLGLMVSGPVVNMFYDLYGTYKGILIVSAAVLVISAITLQLCISSARKCRKEIEEIE